MRALICVAVIGLGSTLALAGPSDHAGRRFGDFSPTGRPEIRKDERAGTAHYALTGERAQRRVLEFRDVPRGRGQSETVPFWRWVTE